MLRINSSLVTRMLMSVAAFAVLVFVLAGGIELWRERGELTRSAHVRADAALGLSSPPIALALWNYDLATLDLLARNLVRDGAIVRVQVLADDGKALVDVSRPGFQLSKALHADVAYQYIKQNDRRGRVHELAVGNSGLYTFAAHLLGATVVLSF